MYHKIIDLSILYTNTNNFTFKISKRLNTLNTAHVIVYN